MNTKNRIEKLEKKFSTDSEFCNCSDVIRTRVIEPDLDRTGQETERLIEEAQKSENCDQCGKVIEKRFIIVECV